MRIQTTTTIVIVGLGSLVALSGCKPKEKTNADLLGAYSGSQYESDMVATDYENVEDQGSSIDPRTQAAIEDTIRTVYVSDFERCLEGEMSRLENRWIGGDFSIEFTIETSGMVSSATILKEDVWERRTLDGDGKYVSEGGADPKHADQFGACVEEHAYKWEFDPPPETVYTHTYNGSVGEAW